MKGIMSIWYIHCNAMELTKAKGSQLKAKDQPPEWTQWLALIITKNRNKGDCFKFFAKHFLRCVIE